MKASFGKPTGTAITSLNTDIRGSKLSKWYRYITAEDGIGLSIVQVKADGHCLKVIFILFFSSIKTYFLPLHQPTTLP